MFVHSARALRALATIVVIFGGLVVASCGGSVSTTPTSTTAPATNAPATTQSIPSTGGSLTLPAAANGQVTKISFAAGAPAGVSLTASSSASGSAPSPSSLKRSTQALAGAVPFLFVTFSVSGSISTQFFAGETVTLANSDPATASYYVELDDVTTPPGTKIGSAGPGSLANVTLTILNSTLSPQTLVPGHTYVLQFYYIPAGTATPTPAPPLANACTSGAAPLSTSAPFASGTVTFTSPTVGGCTGTLALTNISTSGTATLTTQLTAPTGLASPPSNGTAAPFTAIAYFSVTYNNAFTQTDSSVPQITVSIPDVVTGATFYMAQWVTSATGASQFTGYVSSCNNGSPLAMTVSGNTLSLPAQACSGPANGTTAAGTTVTLALVSVPTGTALPSGATCTSGAAPVSTTAPFAPTTTTFTVPTVGGCSGSIVLPSVTTSGTASLTTQLVAPTGLATPPPDASGVPFSTVAFYSATFNNTFTQSNNSQPQVTLNVPSIAVGTRTFYVASWVTPPGGPSQWAGFVSDCTDNNPTAMTVTGNTLSIPALACTGTGSTSPQGTVMTWALIYLPAGTHVSTGHARI